MKNKCPVFFFLLLLAFSRLSAAAPASSQTPDAVSVATLTASDAQLLDGFGVSIAASGDTVVVGASCSHFGGSNCGPGAVYVFVKPAGGWVSMTQTAKLTASDGEPGDNFGIAVAISGDTIVVGADLGCVTGLEAARAYVFVKPATGWQDMTQIAELTPSDGPGCLGYSVGASGDTVVAGAPYTSAGEQPAQGAAYVYREPANGWRNMTQTAKLINSDGQALDELGSSVAISNGTVIAGAPLKNFAIGAAYVFADPQSNGGTITETAKLTATPQLGNSLFGRSVAIDGGVAVIGEPGCLAEGDPHGNAYVFVEPANGWTSASQTAMLSPPDGKDCDEFPNAVAIQKNVIVASEQRARDFTGAVYLFLQPASGWQNTAKANGIIPGTLASNDPESFGFSAAFSDCTLAVGSPGGSIIPDASYVFTADTCPGSDVSHPR